MTAPPPPMLMDLPLVSRPAKSRAAPPSSASVSAPEKTAQATLAFNPASALDPFAMNRNAASVADKLALAVPEDGGAPFYVTAAEINYYRDFAKKLGISRAERWDKRLKLYCACCGQGVRLSHKKTAQESDSGNKPAATHYAAKKQTPHTDPLCPDFKANLDVLRKRKMLIREGERWVIRLGFGAVYASESGSSEQTSRADTQNPQITRPAEVGKSGKKRAAHKITATDLTQLEEIVQILGGDLSHAVFDELYVTPKGQPRQHIRETLYGFDRHQAFIENVGLAKCTLSSLFLLGVSPQWELARTINSGKDCTVPCRETYLQYKGYTFRFDQSLFMDSALYEKIRHASPQNALRINFSGAKAADLIDQMEYIISENISDKRIRLTVRVLSQAETPFISGPPALRLQQEFELTPTK